MSFPSEDEHALAVLAALNAVLPTGRKAYDSDTLRALATLPTDYVEVTVSRRFGGEERGGGYIGTEPYRITTRVVGKTISNARVLRDKVRTALAFNTVTVGALTTTPVAFETEDPIGDDEGLWSGLTLWTYVV